LLDEGSIWDSTDEEVIPMRLIHHNGIKALQFPALSALSGFFHGIFLRGATDGQGGIIPFDIGMGGVTPEALVRSNRRRMAAFFGAGLRSVYGRQVHGREVGVLRRDGNRPHRNTDGFMQLNGDALITDLEGSALVILVADCQPVIIIDPVKRVVANVHSGWRGSIKNIVGETIRRMAVVFHSRPEDLVCGIGPSLGPCCAEFIHYKDELPEPFWTYRNSAFHFDFWQASRDQLTDAGVRIENIHISGLCTRCNPSLFFSYRGERRTGRFAAVVGLEPGKGSGR
jgi:polyphenol oxidase